MKLSEVGSAVLDQNKESFTGSAKRRAGRMFNERVVGLVAPKLPLMLRGYANEPWFKFAMSNALAGAIIKFGYENDKLISLAEAGIDAAADDFLGSLNLEAVINELIDGIELPGTNEVLGGE